MTEKTARATECLREMLAEPARSSELAAKIKDIEHEGDKITHEVVQALHPDRIVVQISTDGLASGGGTIHCATQEQPLS